MPKPKQLVLVKGSRNKLPRKRFRRRGVKEVICSHIRKTREGFLIPCEHPARLYDVGLARMALCLCCANRMARRKGIYIVQVKVENIKLMEENSVASGS